jgi:hypothetical protein
MNNSDDFDACEARIDIRCRAVLGDPLEHVFNGTTIFDSLTVAGDGCGRMKSRAHEISVACASARDIAVHGAGDRVMCNEVRVGWFDRGEALGFVDQDFVGKFGA